MFLSRFLALSIFYLLIFNQSVFSADLNGNIMLTERGRKASTEEYKDIVVYFIPDSKVDLKASQNPEKQNIAMENKEYMPRVLTVSQGTEVGFPNHDDIKHNVFSTTPGNEFDLGLYDGGESKSHTYNTPGLSRVYCNVHHAMVAYVLTFDSPFYTQTDATGNFQLNNLPDVAGDLYIWHPRAKPQKQKLDLTQVVTSNDYELDLTLRRIPQHNNKDGISYREAKKLKSEK